MTSSRVAMRDERNWPSQAVLSPNVGSRNADATTHPSALVDPHEDLASRSAASLLSTTIHTLPPEILSEIFFQSTLKYPASSRNLGTPAIARVCQEWRAVAFGHPRLWTTVNIHASHISSHDDVEAYLARSCQAPLSVYAEAQIDVSYLNAVPEAVAATRQVAEVLYRVAALSAYRWEMLSVIGDCILFSRQAELQTPLLERVVLMVTTWLEQHEGPLPLAFVQNASRVREATITVGYGQPPIMLPAWSQQLTTVIYILYYGEAHEFDTIVRHLSAQPDLRRLELLDGFGDHAFIFSVNVNLGPSVFHLPKLIEMAVSGLGHLFLPKIDAPILQKLKVTGGIDEDEERTGSVSITSLTRVLARASMRSLRTLELIDFDIDEYLPLDDLYRCLEGLPALATLRIENGKEEHRLCPFLRPELLAWLARDESAPARLPALTRLTLRFDGWSCDGREDLLRQIMVSRATSGTAHGIPFKTLARLVCDLGHEYQLP
ncbi:uncharacterized protein SCHCODRAFT_02638939 [Schizophyllum commune H4-8]|nr:uncharacterized protein SCHCODRAFT_02638939 [Schizophyllum commune H4-8]KAI5887772.1 hypothetical protein SCHCODRAFT_02638939 [Schizophyllum commune H4-8]